MYDRVVSTVMGCVDMEISYMPLWKLLLEKNIQKKELGILAGLSKGTIDRMVQGKNVSIETLAKICMALDCDLSDIVEIRKK